MPHDHGSEHQPMYAYLEKDVPEALHTGDEFPVGIRK
jgi:hypothetical protein